MKASAHRDVISSMGNRPGAYPTAELIMRLDQDHRYATFGQSDRSRDPGNAAARHDDLLGAVGEPCRAGWRRMPDGASIRARPPARSAAPNDHEMSCWLARPEGVQDAALPARHGADLDIR